LESSPPELSDPSPIDEIVFCGMNFFNTRYIVMVIHIVNGFEAEKPSFLQFISKTEQFCGLVLARKNQIRRRLPWRPVENATDRVIGNTRAEQVG